jgi:PAS domain S-box-containing protein
MTAPERDDPAGSRGGHVRVLSAATTNHVVGQPANGAVTERSLHELVDDTPDGQLVIDGHGPILRVNPGLETLFGYDRSELLDQPIGVLVPEEARGAHVTSREVFAIDPKIRATGRGPKLTGRRRDGTPIPVDVQLSPLPTKAGVWVVAVIRDDTHCRTAEAQRQVTSLATEDQRNAVELGDTVIHHLFGVGLRLQTLLPRAGEHLHDELTEIVAGLDIIREIRTLAFGVDAHGPDASPANPATQ